MSEPDLKPISEEALAAMDEHEREEALMRIMFNSVLSTDQGKAFLHYMLMKCDPITVSATLDPYQEFENRGRRRVGCEIISDCLRYAPTHYQALLSKMCENLASGV